MGMNFEQARFNMVEQQIRPWDVLEPEILELFSVVKREDFVPEHYRELAFADVEIPLKPCQRPGQCLLIPGVEARMLQALNVKTTDKVLEVGTGSGYMAALLAARAEFVYSVEIDPGLVNVARDNLQRAGVANVSVDLGDAASGWDLYAPYDVIVVSGSLPTLPETLLRQLRVGGRLIAIVGEMYPMEVRRVKRTQENTFSSESLFETMAAPLFNALPPAQFVF